ncbi:MAG TPA: GNAT family N-acetyltransferase [Acidimicrobiales bacterium]|nr:GNAT family N-acetyltransferase [Acidimicrobiales bacterium]
MAVAVHATAADLPAVTEVLTAAFADDPVQQWLFAPADDPDAGRRALFEIFVEDYFWLGHAHVVADAGGIAGAAMWSPPDRDVLRGDRVQDLFGALTPHLGDALVPRLGELARTHEHRPAEPHLYLGILGVDPGRQSRGLGTSLLAPTLAECDRTGLLAHLESSNERNIPFYERHGFAVVDAYRCGGDGPLMTMMTRRPR